MIATRTVAVEVAHGLRVQVVAGRFVPYHLRALYLAEVGEGDGAATAPSPEPTPEPPVATAEEPSAPAAEEEGPEAEAVVEAEEDEAEGAVVEESAAEEPAVNGGDDGLDALSRQDLMRTAAAEGVPAKG